MIIRAFGKHYKPIQKRMAKFSSDFFWTAIVSSVPDIEQSLFLRQGGNLGLVYHAVHFCAIKLKALAIFAHKIFSSS